MASRRPLSSLGDVLGKSRALRQGDNLPWHVWREVVGYRIASRSKPRALEGRTLHVTVSSSAWAQELSFLARTIVQKLMERGSPVRALRFSVGAVEVPERAPKPRKVTRQTLPGALRERLQRLEDPKLRELIAEAASYGEKNER